MIGCGRPTTRLVPHRHRTFRGDFWPVACPPWVSRNGDGPYFGRFGVLVYGHVASVHPTSGHGIYHSWVISIRQYEPADYEACRHRLWVQLAQHHRDIYDAPHIGGDDPGADFDKHLTLVGPERIWVAEIDGQVVGLTGLIVTDESSEIEPIIVDPKYRRRGVASALIDHLKEVVRVQELPELMVRPVARNALILDFLSKHGFNTLGLVELIIRPEGSARWVEGAEVSGVRFKV
jgi:GNAT superfamily N-acetyltransferase